MKTLLIVLLALVLSGCGATMTAVGSVESNRIYVIAHGDFLSTTRMILVVDPQGKVVASTGGTVQGGGAVTTQSVLSLINTGATLYGFTALSSALQGASVTVKGIPSDVGVHASGTVHGTATIDGKPGTFNGTVAP